MTRHGEGKDCSQIGEEDNHPSAIASETAEKQVPKWRKFLGKSRVLGQMANSEAPSDDFENTKRRPAKSSLGILNDKETAEVPGSVLLMSKTNHNEPLGLQRTPARTSASSLPSPYPPGLRPIDSRQDSRRVIVEKKRTPDGGIILEPQPDDSMNDPLNWPAWRRDIALISLGFYCMLGGGMTPILAAGFNDVARTYDISVPEVALTTGLYMMGLGLGSVVASPTAILYGKRPVYLVGIILYIISSVWCAVSPTYASLIVARIFMGFAVSPVECLPSATIAEIFFLHERAYRLGIYTLLLLSGKNLIPLVSAAIIESLSWRWVFWIVAMIVVLCFFLMFFFVPETFWDRTPRPYSKSRFANISGLFHASKSQIASAASDGPSSSRMPAINAAGIAQEPETTSILETTQQKKTRNVEHADKSASKSEYVLADDAASLEKGLHMLNNIPSPAVSDVDAFGNPLRKQEASHLHISSASPNVKDAAHEPSGKPILHVNCPPSPEIERANPHPDSSGPNLVRSESATSDHITTNEKSSTRPGSWHYTSFLQSQPAKSFKQTLKPWNGRLCQDNWFLVALRPFILFAYPAVLWSTLVYSLSIGWLIVLSESVSTIYRSKETYNFSSLGTGLVYISPFIGGILGTVVAGKVSDIIVRFMSRRNDGIYEPEFRLVMAIPVTISTCIGLMGFGWSAAEKDRWIVPTVFFGVISFGCSLGSTTAITFAVDSYRQYAGEALVTLNFSKNIFHGLVFSLFFNSWLEADGSKNVFLAIGGIQLACLLTTVPMYIFGKRARMWTVRKNLMEKF
ncbi:hypothetical protein MMC07_000706 [Pseudocyphellaria aurata]|nr:hypothetical protein [Pseudocyphellaria aurata]